MTTVKDWIMHWALIIFCSGLVIGSMVPLASTVQEWWKPVIDTLGSNMENMDVDKPPPKYYRCGERVDGFFRFQKQRHLVGQIKWQLVKGADERIFLYPFRTVAAQSGIINHWAPIEKLPDVCEPGQYHFEGLLTYPLGFGRQASYPLRTVCFEVRQ